MPAGGELGVDLVERRDELLARRESRSRGSDRLTYRQGSSTSAAYGSSSPSCVRSTKSVTPASTRLRTSIHAFSGPQAHGMAAGDEAAVLDDGGRTHDGEVCRRPATPSEGSVSYGGERVPIAVAWRRPTRPRSSFAIALSCSRRSSASIPKRGTCACSRRSRRRASSPISERSCERTGSFNG